MSCAVVTRKLWQRLCILMATFHQNSCCMSPFSQRPTLHHLQPWQWESLQRNRECLVCPVLELCLTGVISQSHILICFLGFTEDYLKHPLHWCLQFWSEAFQNKNTGEGIKKGTGGDEMKMDDPDKKIWRQIIIISINLNLHRMCWL